jgi:DNA invertase Pin-like site-specific DNA recombinase
MNGKQAVVYCRVSSLEQVDGTSLESQERMCREYADRAGITILEVFVDRGESAKTADRPEFLNAISYCTKKRNLVDFFIVYKIDRFARNQNDHIGVRAKLKQHDVELLSVTEPINDSPMGKMMEGILSTFAEFDNNIRTERSSNGMRERLKQGLWVWPAPIGYTRLEQGGVLVPNSDARFVQMAFAEYAKGTYTYKRLATNLYKQGLRSKAGKKVELQTLQKLIHNPLYCGIVKKDEWGIETKGKHEPLITIELFSKCQVAGRSHKGTKKQEKNPEFPLRRLIVCSWCKQPLTGSFSTGRKGTKYPYYHHHKQTCSHALSIKKQELEDSFVSFLREINPSFKFATAFKKACMDIYQADHQNALLQNQTVKQQLAKLQEKKKTIYDHFEEGLYTKTDFIERKRDVERQLYAVQSQIITIEGTDTDFEKCLDYCMEFVTSTAETWQQLANQPEKRLRFQNFVFEGSIEYSKTSGFGTAQLSPIYSVYQQYLLDESSLVMKY